MEKLSSLMTALSLVLALGAGGVMALQPAVNGKLATRCEHPLQASMISFGTGLAALVLVGLLMRTGLPSISQLQGLPYWAWTGGLLGTYMVTVSLLIAPRLGATRWIALVLTGQIALSLVLDHFGWIGYTKQPLNWLRVVGVVCLVVGVLIVMKK